MAPVMTLDIQNVFIFIVLFLFALLCYSLIFKKPEKGYDLAPSPPSLPIIGHLHLLLSSQLHKTLQKLSSKYGSILYLRIFNFPIVVVSSASLTNEIIKAQDVNVSSRNFPTNEDSIFLGSSGFVSVPYGDYYKFVKKLIVTKILGPQALDMSRGVRRHAVEMFYSSLREKAMRKESVEIVEEAVTLTNNILYKMATGKSCSEETHILKSLVTESDTLLKKFFVAAILRKLLAKFGISLFKKELADISRKFDEVLEKILVDYEVKRGERHQDTCMIGVLLEASEDENAEYKITRFHIKSLLVELFIGGIDTSSRVIEWIMAELINNPNVLLKLREEIDSVVGKTRMIQEADLPNLPYLQATVKEGLRLHPAGPIVPRTFREGCKVGSFYFPEKATLMVNIYDMMRDARYWKDPNKFMPERFLSTSRLRQEEDMRNIVLNYVPFGFGRRRCPGSNLAYISAEIAVGVMVQGFDWEIEGDMVNMEDAPGTMSLRMNYPLKCIHVPRTPDLSTLCI